MDALTKTLGTAFNAVIPSFVLIAFGALADRLLPELNLETLSRLSVYLLIPALIFSALTSTDLSLRAAAHLSLAYFVYLLALSGLALVGSLGMKGAQRSAVVVASLFGNTGNMGLPITLFAYGQAGLERAVVLLVLSLLLMFTLGPLVLSPGDARMRTRLLEALKLPPLWAAVAGLVVNGSGLELPLSLARSTELLAQAAIPTLLLSLGIQMRRGWTWKVGGVALRTVVLRLGLGPFVAYGVASLLNVTALDLKVLVLSAAMPTAVTMFVVAVEVGGDYGGFARSVVLTTLGSVLAILAVLSWLP